MKKKTDMLNLSGATGTISRKDLEASPGYLSEEDLKRGPVVVIECTEEIPCNPCETICKRGAIEVGEPITNLPRVDPAKCNACGICISICPGLAIFLIDVTCSENEATISLPHEHLPLPKEGGRVEAVNRKGEPVCSGKVVKVRNPKSYDHTPVVTIAIPRRYFNEVRGIR